MSLPEPPPMPPIQEVNPAPTGDALSIRWVTDAISDPPPEPPVLIEGMLRRGELCVIGAPRAIGKSFFAGNLASLLGIGEGYLGGSLRIAKSAAALIAHGEIDEWESSRRWQMQTGTGQPPTNVAETFDRWRIRTVKHRRSSGGKDSGNHYNDTDEWIDAILDPRLEATIATHGFEVLIIDPWAVYYAGNENSNDETEAALDKLRALAMRYGLAIVILHHLGKATDAREPEDLWRGASRLADWASTRITIMPHWTDKQAREQGMTRQQARRYVDVHFLRRSTPTDNFSMKLSETGWWERWVPPSGLADVRRIHLSIDDVVDACRKAGGSWSSTTKAATDLDISVNTATSLLESCERHGALEHFDGDRNARGWRLPGRHLHLVTSPEVTE